MNLEKIGKLISQKRKDLNLTQEQLASQLGITAKAVSKWECAKGLPDASIMQELCNILNIGVDELLSGEQKESKQPINNKVNYHISKIRNIIGKSKNITIEAIVNNLKTIEIENSIIVILSLEDETGTIIALLVGNKDQEFTKILNKIKTKNYYRIRGNILVKNEISNQIFTKLNNLVDNNIIDTIDNKILAVNAIERISD